MNFLFVDRILELEPGKRALGCKHVSANDCYLTPTPEGKPALLSCIVGEALGQLCSWCVIKATDCQVRSVGGIVTAVNMYDQAYLGDTVILEINVEELDDQAVNWHGQAKIGDKVILDIESSIGPCLPMSDFNDPEQVRIQLNMIDRPGEIEPQLEGQIYQPDLVQYNQQLVQFDRILEWQAGKQIVAEKQVSVIAPYFVDHFPRKPVLPISVLLETKLQLARHYISTELEGGAGFLSNTHQYLPKRVYNIKMNDFVLPGDRVITKMKIKSQTEEQIIFQFRSEVNQRRICVAEAEFVKVS